MNTVKLRVECPALNIKTASIQCKDAKILTDAIHIENKPSARPSLREEARLPHLRLPHSLKMERSLKYNFLFYFFNVVLRCLNIFSIRCGCGSRSALAVFIFSAGHSTLNLTVFILLFFQSIVGI